MSAAEASASSTLVANFRLQNGLCVQCGTCLYRVEHGSVREPLNVEGIVKNGRCLYCFPDSSAPAKGSTAAGGSAEAAMNDSSFPPNGSGSSSSEELNSVQSTTPPPSSSQKRKGKSPGKRMSPSPTSPGKRKRQKSHHVTSADVPVRVKEEPGQLPKVHKKRGEEKSKKSSTPAKELVTEIKDSDDNVFKGKVLRGNVQKGYGIFTFKHKSGKSKGKQIRYEGRFENGFMEGHGKSEDEIGCVYEGTWHLGAAHGKGKCTWEDESSSWTYTGEWVMDSRQGVGILRQDVNDGEVYDGEWLDDKWHGQGTLKFAGGGKYIGEFVEHKLQGHGRYEFRDGSIYTGAFKNDERVGYGEMTYEDGLRYEGDWKGNWREGKGKLLYNDGSMFEGMFRGDEPESGLLYLPDGIVKRVRYNNGQLVND